MLHRIILACCHASRISKLTQSPVNVLLRPDISYQLRGEPAYVWSSLDKVAVTAQPNPSALSDTGNDKPLAQLSGFGRGTPHYGHDRSHRNSLYGIREYSNVTSCHRSTSPLTFGYENQRIQTFCEDYVLSRRVKAAAQH